ncbi:hypothetical protein YC2023_027355 [Brassica napus]
MNGAFRPRFNVFIPSTPPSLDYPYGVLAVSTNVFQQHIDVKTNTTVFKTLLCFIEQVGLETQVGDIDDVTGECCIYSH